MGTLDPSATTGNDLFYSGIPKAFLKLNIAQRTIARKRSLLSSLEMVGQW